MFLAGHIERTHTKIEMALKLAELIAEKQSCPKCEEMEEKIEKLIFNAKILTLIPSQPLDMNQACDMVRDYFINQLKDLLKHSESLTKEKEE